MSDDITKIAAYNGMVFTMNLLIEEMAELTKEIMKEQRGIGNMDNLIEELADVELVLEEFKYILGKDDLIEKFKREKITRTKERYKI